MQRVMCLEYACGCLAAVLVLGWIERAVSVSVERD